MMAVESSAAYLAGLLTEELAPEANAILSAPGNGVCFDCGAVDPEWVSIQHATVVCIGCAGEHRALGPALSHIRSLRFDTLSKNELAAMHAGGNAKLRAWIAAGQPGRHRARAAAAMAAHRGDAARLGSTMPARRRREIHQSGATVRATD